MSDNAHQRQQLIEGGFTPTVELTDWHDEDIAVLRRYGAWFEVLGNGEVAPSTDAQKHFTQVAQGLVAPTTRYEVLWRRYLMAKKQAAIDSNKAFVDGVASYRISQISTELGQLRRENEALRRKAEVLENQLSNTHKTLAKYELPPKPLVIDHVAEMQKNRPPLPLTQVVYASTDGQD